MIYCPSEYVGAVVQLCERRRGTLQKMDYLTPERVELHYRLPLAEIVFDFFDRLKSSTRGYASLDYEPAGMEAREARQGRHPAQRRTRRRLQRDRPRRRRPTSTAARWSPSSRELIPRQLFDVPIQAAIGSKIIARETIKARRKDVIAKCYGGDITRKRKLLEKQKEGKKRMKSVGMVEIPQEAFVAALSIDD